MSTSPGSPRSSHGTSRGSTSRRPSSGIDAHASRATSSGWPRVPPYEAATTSPPSARQLADDAADRRSREPRPVREHDDRSLDVVAQRREAAPERGAGAVGPAGAAHESGPTVQHPLAQRVGALDDDDLVDRRPLEALEHAWQQQLLLRRAEPGRGAGGQHDRGDAAHDEDAVTDSITTGWSGCSVCGSPSAPISSTTSRPSVTSPTIA